MNHVRLGRKKKLVKSICTADRNPALALVPRWMRWDWIPKNRYALILICALYSMCRIGRCNKNIVPRRAQTAAESRDIYFGTA